jgi:hypothetical protein
MVKPINQVLYYYIGGLSGPKISMFISTAFDLTSSADSNGSSNANMFNFVLNLFKDGSDPKRFDFHMDFTHLHLVIMTYSHDLHGNQ